MIRKEVSFKGDSKGYLGRKCPKYSCQHFFKINIADFQKGGNFYHFCPYCGIKKHHNEFLTEEQRNYLKSIALKEARKLLVSHLKQIENRFPMLGISFTVSPSNIYVQHYAEKILNNEIVCPTCNFTYITTEPSFFCPYCGILPPITQWNQIVKEVKTKIGFIESKEIPEEAQKALKESGFFRNLLETTAKDVVTGFETYCKNKFADLVYKKFPSSIADSIIKKIGISFQNLDKGNQLFITHLSYDYKTSVTTSQFTQLNLIFQKRHVLIHNNGIIDQKFIKNTNSSPGLLGQRITLNSYEIIQTITNLSKIINNIKTII